MGQNNGDFSSSEENQDDVHSINCNGKVYKKGSDVIMNNNNHANDKGSKLNLNGSSSLMAGYISNPYTGISVDHIDQQIIHKLNKHIMVFQFYEPTQFQEVQLASRSDNEMGNDWHLNQYSSEQNLYEKQNHIQSSKKRMAH